MYATKKAGKQFAMVLATKEQESEQPKSKKTRVSNQESLQANFK